MAIRNSPTVISTEPLADPTNPQAVKRAFDQLRHRVLQLSTASTATAAVTSAAAIPSATAVTTSNVTLSGIPSAIDDVTLVADDILLVAGNTTASENGLYVVGPGAWERVTFADGDSISGASVYVNQGQFYGTTRWRCTSLIGADVVGTNNLTFELESELLPDIGFDSNDVFAVIYGDSVDTDVGTISSQISADTWTSYNYASTADLTAATAWLRGPFGEQALYMRTQMGILGPASTYPMPANYTLTFWAEFEQCGNGVAFSSTQLLSVARANTNTPTGAGWPTEYMFAVSCPQNGAPGSGSDPLRYINIRSVDSGGTASPFTPALTNELGGIVPIGRWHHIAITRRSDNYTYLYVNGVYITAFLTTNAPDSASTGRWIIGRPGNVSAAGVICGNYFRVSRVRLSSVEWSVAWIKEQARRGLSWCV